MLCGGLGVTGRELDFGQKQPAGRVRLGSPNERERILHTTLAEAQGRHPHERFSSEVRKRLFIVQNRGLQDALGVDVPPPCDEERRVHAATHRQHRADVLLLASHCDPVRPLSRALKVTDAAARAQHLAARERYGDRIGQLPGARGQSRLVQQP